MLVYTISKGTNKSYVYDVYRGVKGEKGDQGPQGEQGIQGIPGAAATIQVGNVTSGAVPAVTNVGTSSAAIFDFVIPKGDKGDQGPVGQAAGFGTPTASASTLSAGSDATVSVTASGDATQKVFAFSFGIPEGDKGDKGDQGIQGETGPAAGFGTPTASATLLPSGSTPTASVTASGADTSKVFAFSFGIPAGDTNVQADWAETNTSADDYIKNKPTIPVVATAIASGDTGYTTGDQVYTALQSAGSDVWEFWQAQLNKYSFGDRTRLQGFLFKNGIRAGNETVYFQSMYKQNGTAKDGWSSSVTLNNGSFTYDFQSASLYDDPTVTYIEVELYNNANRDKLLATYSITKLTPAASIASGDYGYTTGDQVYQVIGNINTILQSI